MTDFTFTKPMHQIVEEAGISMAEMAEFRRKQKAARAEAKEQNEEKEASVKAASRKRQNP